MFRVGYQRHFPKDDLREDILSSLLPEVARIKQRLRGILNIFCGIGSNKKLYQRIAAFVCSLISNSQEYKCGRSSVGRIVVLRNETTGPKSSECSFDHSFRRKV